MANSRATCHSVGLLKFSTVGKHKYLIGYSPAPPPQKRRGALGGSFYQRVWVKLGQSTLVQAPPGQYCSGRYCYLFLDAGQGVASPALRPDG